MVPSQELDIHCRLLGEMEDGTSLLGTASSLHEVLLPLMTKPIIFVDS